MKLIQRIEAFSQLGAALKQGLWQPDFSKANALNPWFTRKNVERAIQGILRFLDAGSLTQWTKNYQLDEIPPRQVGIIMAGNIPMVGFHDLLCVLICGHRAQIKLSDKDPILLPSLWELLLDLCPEMQVYLQFGNLQDAELNGLIATGSDNTARYVEYQYRAIPKIIRKNRTSHALLNGEESEATLSKLAEDLFSYFGKGCRNVSKLWLPMHYDLQRLEILSEKGRELLETEAYLHNHLYQKALLKSLGENFIDLGGVLMQETQAVVSPLGLLYYQYYHHQEELQQLLSTHTAKIQCLVADNEWYPGSIQVGTTQLPEIDDYADKVDTISFLQSLS